MTISIAVACAATPPSSASLALIARCGHLYDLWWRYDEDPVFFGMAERPTAELALYNCHQGRYAEGIQALEQLLRNGRFRFPDDGRSQAGT